MEMSVTDDDGNQIESLIQRRRVRVKMSCLLSQRM
jgi:hypothetical protein